MRFLAGLLAGLAVWGSVLGGAAFLHYEQADSSSPGIALARAALWDPATSSWTPGGSLRTARADHRAVAIDGTRVLVVGGHDAAGNHVPSAEIWSEGRFTSAGTTRGEDPGLAVSFPGGALVEKSVATVFARAGKVTLAPAAAAP